MNTTRNYIILSIFFSLTLCLNANATKKEFTKIIEKEYDANTYKKIDITNRYGEIRILDWDKPTIHINVTITLQHDDQEKANKLFDKINVIFNEEGDLVKVSTNIEEDFGTSQGWFTSKEGKEFRIDYEVNLPKNTNVKLENKYGNIFINNLAGHADINLRYGDININTLSRGSDKPFNQLTLAYGKANIGECGWLNFNLSYSKASIQTCKTLIMISKYSKIKIEKASTIAGESAYDVISVQSLDNFVISGKYGTYEVDQIAKKIETETKYSNINVQYVHDSFENINMTNDYGNINLGIDPKACYEIEAKMKYAKINYPDNGRVNRISEGNKTNLSGYIGDSKCNSKVNIQSNYGGVNLMK